MPALKLNVIPKPPEGTRAVLQTDRTDKGFVYFSGSGSLDLVCGNCANVLAKGMAEGQLRNLVLLCNQCNSYNEIP